MQFIEKNSLNVKAAIYHLKKKDALPEFVLFPMIHIGSKQYYAEVEKKIAQCDLVLVEGVRSRKATLLTLSYQVVKKIKRLDLVTQGDALNLRSVCREIINPDIDKASFETGWNSLPWLLRLQLILFLPWYIIWLFLFGTRESIAENLAIDDLPSRDEILFSDEDTEAMDRLLLDERDQRLLWKLEDLNTTNSSQYKIIGIVYGAMHMRAVASFLLDKLNYRITDSEWVVVFEL